MKWDDIDQQVCSVARALSVLGERWTLLIIRDAFRGTRRFDDFQRSLGVTRHRLSERLGKLVDEGVLTRVAYMERPTRYEYRLTRKGLALYPGAVARWQLAIGTARSLPLMVGAHCFYLRSPLAFTN